MIAKSQSGLQWIQYGVLHGGVDPCRSDVHPSIFNLVDNPENLKWIKEKAFNESYGKFKEDDAEYMLLMEYNKFLSHLADSRLPSELDSNDDFKDWLR